MTETRDKTGAAEGVKIGSMSRGLLWIKAFLFFALMILTGYGMVNEGLFQVQRWVPVALIVLATLFITLFVVRYYEDVPLAGWVLVGFLALLVLVKGLSIIWSIGPPETVLEILRSSMYLAIFAVALASLPNRRQIPWLLDGSIIIAALVTGYALLQKVDPLSFPPSSLDGVRASSQLGYPNTAALVIGLGVVLALSRMTEVRSIAARSLYAVMGTASLVAIYFTFSRGGLLMLGLGVAVLFILTHARLQMFANLTLFALPAAVLLYSVRNLEGLSAQDLLVEERLADGSTLQTALLGALAAALALQLAFALFASRYELTPNVRRALGGVVLAGVVLVGLAGFGALYVQYGGVSGMADSFTGGIGEQQDQGDRLTSLSANSRLAYWGVAAESWRENPLLGTGAGTFLYTWQEDRPGFSGARQVHNLYLEQGTETGVVAFLALAGFALYLTFYAVRATLRATGERRMWLSALSAAVILYLASSALEWHWYIPPSTMLFFLLAAAAVKLAARPDWEEPSEDYSPRRPSHSPTHAARNTKQPAEERSGGRLGREPGKGPGGSRPDPDGSRGP